MKKVITSAFVLLLLLPILWAGSAWYSGLKTEKLITQFLKKQQYQSSSLFNLELIDYERSFISTNAQFRLLHNSKNTLSLLLMQEYFDDKNNIIDVRILHGPILKSNKQLQFGNSAWEVEPKNSFIKDDKPDSNDLFAEFKIHKTNMFINFERDILYHLTVVFKGKEILIDGVFKAESNKHKGKLSSPSLDIDSQLVKLAIDPVELDFEQVKTSETNDLKFSTKPSKIILDHHLLNKNVNLNATIAGEFSLKNGQLNGQSRFYSKFEPNANSYPLPADDAEFKLQINDLSLATLFNLSNFFNEQQSLQQQSQWLVEEQGEFPEGQNQIWRIQDSAEQKIKQLPVLVKKILIEDVNGAMTPKITFKLNSTYKNKASSINGAFLPNKIEKDNMIPLDSLWSLIQAKANVHLDNRLLNFLSKQFPITKANFKLTYKQNKLLMQ